MGAGLLQLVATSFEDIILTEQPEITLFKTIYRRHSSFSIMPIKLNFTGNFTYNSENYCEINKYADFVKDLYLKIELPQVTAEPIPETASYINNTLLSHYGITWNYRNMSGETISGIVANQPITELYQAESLSGIFYYKSQTISGYTLQISTLSGYLNEIRTNLDPISGIYINTSGSYYPVSGSMYPTQYLIRCLEDMTINYNNNYNYTTLSGSNITLSGFSLVYDYLNSYFNDIENNNKLIFGSKNPYYQNPTLYYTENYLMNVDLLYERILVALLNEIIIKNQYPYLESILLAYNMIYMTDNLIVSNKNASEYYLFLLNNYYKILFRQPIIYNDVYLTYNNIVRTSAFTSTNDLNNSKSLLLDNIYGTINQYLYHFQDIYSSLTTNDPLISCRYYHYLLSTNEEILFLMPGTITSYQSDVLKDRIIRTRTNKQLMENIINNNYIVVDKYIQQMNTDYNSFIKNLEVAGNEGLIANNTIDINYYNNINMATLWTTLDGISGVTNDVSGIHLLNKIPLAVNNNLYNITAYDMSGVVLTDFWALNQSGFEELRNTINNELYSDINNYQILTQDNLTLTQLKNIDSTHANVFKPPKIYKYNRNGEYSYMSVIKYINYSYQSFMVDKINEWNTTSLSGISGECYNKLTDLYNVFKMEYLPPYEEYILNNYRIPYNNEIFGNPNDKIFDAVSVLYNILVERLIFVYSGLYVNLNNLMYTLSNLGMYLYNNNCITTQYLDNNLLDKNDDKLVNIVNGYGWGNNNYGQATGNINNSYGNVNLNGDIIHNLTKITTYNNLNIGLFDNGKLYYWGNSSNTNFNNIITELNKYYEFIDIGLQNDYGLYLIDNYNKLYYINQNLTTNINDYNISGSYLNIYGGEKYYGITSTSGDTFIRNLSNQTLSTLSGITNISFGRDTVMTLNTSGDVSAWYYTDSGTTIEECSGLSNIISIATGYVHYASLNSSGVIYTWYSSLALDIEKNGQCFEKQDGSNNPPPSILTNLEYSMVGAGGYYTGCSTNLNNYGISGIYYKYNNQLFIVGGTSGQKQSQLYPLDISQKGISFNVATNISGQFITNCCNNILIGQDHVMLEMKSLPYHYINLNNIANSGLLIITNNLVDIRNNYTITFNDNYRDPIPTNNNYNNQIFNLVKTGLNYQDYYFYSFSDSGINPISIMDYIYNLSQTGTYGDITNNSIILNSINNQLNQSLTYWNPINLTSIPMVNFDYNLGIYDGINSNRTISGQTVGILTDFNISVNNPSNPYTVGTDLYEWYSNNISGMSIVERGNYINFINDLVVNIFPTNQKSYVIFNNINKSYFSLFQNNVNCLDFISYFISFINNTFSVFYDKRTSISSTNINIYNTVCSYYTTLMTTLTNYINNMNSLTDNTIMSYFNGSTVNISWINNIGYNIFDEIDLMIGDEQIEKLTNDWLFLYNELTITNEKLRGHNILIGNVVELLTPNTTLPLYQLYISLPFWFCRYANEALPLIALNNTVVRLRIKTKNLNDLIQIENKDQIQGKYKLIYNNTNSNSYILGTFIYVSDDERMTIARSKHEYLADYNINLNEIFLDVSKLDVCTNNLIVIKTIINPKATNLYDKYVYTIQIRLDGNCPCKELIWTFQDVSTEFGEYYYQEQYQYGLCLGNEVVRKVLPYFDNAYIKFFGLERETVKEYNFYQCCYPSISHTRVPNKNIYTYPFSIYPEELQPSGSANFSKISDIYLCLTLSPYLIQQLLNGNKKYRINIFGRFTNILRIMSGMGGLAFI